MGYLIVQEIINWFYFTDNWLGFSFMIPNTSIYLKYWDALKPDKTCPKSSASLYY